MLFFLKEAELMIYNGRNLVSENESTRVRPSVKQKFIIDYNITDTQLLEMLGNVHVNDMYIGSSDYFLVWMELDRTSKTSRRREYVVK